MNGADEQVTDPQQAGRLAGLAADLGEQIEGGGNRPVLLSDPGALWFVASGTVDVFAARLRDDGVPTDFKHLLRAEPGRLLFPSAEVVGGSVLVAKGLPDSRLRQMSVDALAGAGIDEETARQADVWVSQLSEAVARDITYRPRIDRLVVAGSEEEVEAGLSLAASHGVVWLSDGDVRLAYLDTEEPDPAGLGLTPVTSASWAGAQRQGRVRCADSLDLQREGRLLAALAEFNAMALSADDLNRRLLLADTANLQAAGTRYRRQREERARRSLFGVLERGGARSEEGPPLPQALQRVGKHEGIVFRLPQGRARGGESAGEGPSLAGILTASGVRARRVALRPEQRWWLGDSGAILAMRRDDGAPVALIPSRLGRYRMIEPESARSRLVNGRRAGTLAREAYFFYRPLPDDRPADTRQILRLAFHRMRGDLVRMIATGLLAGVAMLLPAVLLDAFVESALPSGSLRVLLMVTLAAVLVAVVFGLMQMLKDTAVMRLEGRAAARAGAALWHRMLNLPSSFFRRHTAGDLATRAMAFHELRDQVSGVVAGALLSVLFLLPTFALMFLYSTPLGWLCLGLGLVSLGITLSLGLLQVSHHRTRLSVVRRLAGVLLQLIGGVRKLRATGSEGAAFAMWAEDYRGQKQAELRLGRYNDHLMAFTAATPFLATAALFVVGLDASEDGLPLGSFLAVYAAFMVFFGAVVQLGFVFSAIAAIVPSTQQMAPILAERPRSNAADGAVPELKGEILLDHVTFRYSDAGPMVLRDVSIHVRPGEFVALVGESGAGKSTIFRLVLGLEKPLSGAVYYDGHDLERLNLAAARRRTGVVVQDSNLRPQTVLDNVIGISGDLTVDDAWQAARLALVDADIAALPMGMFTVTSESATAFSGGQVQRFMLAGALARHPSILLLDEATSWLDNRTQAEVMEQMEKLSMTRIVSAHRLSTIRRADRIYVLQEGRVVQQGTFATLMDEDGVFRDLARRQMS